MTVAIALDTSSRRTGYVRGPVDGSAPLKISNFGLIREDKHDIGAGMIEFREALRPRLTGVDIIFMEKPALPFGSLNYDTLRILYGIAGMVEVMAIDMGIPCFDVDNGKHKKLIYGKGGTKPKNPEELAASWGFDVDNDDEADAAGVFLYSVQQFYPQEFTHWQRIKQSNPLVPFIPKPKKKKKPRKKNTK